VISGYELPGSTGVDFLETVRDTYPDLPFILFAGNGSETVASDAISAGVTGYHLKRVGTSQFASLASQVLDAVEQRRQQQWLEKRHQINRAVREISQMLVTATSRESIDQQVCQVLSDTGPYQVAWVGTVDTVTDQIELRAAAGFDAAPPGETTTATESEAKLTEDGPIATAVRTGRITVVQDVHSNKPFLPRGTMDGDRSYGDLAVIPLVGHETRQGVLVIHSGEANVFGPSERSLLSELGETITQAYRRLEAQHQYEDQYRQLFEHAPVMVAFTRAEDGEPIIEDCNGRFAGRLGYTREELCGRHLKAVYTEKSTEALLQKGGHRRALSGEFVREQRELTTRKGAVITTLLRATPRRDEEGNIIGTIALYVDITDQTRLKTLEALRERMEFALTATDSVLFELDLESRERTVNGEFKRLFGVAPDHITASEDFYERCVHPADRERVRASERLRSFDETSGVIEYEFRTHPERGEVRWIGCQAYISAGSDGGPQRFVGVHTDITERKERKRDRQERLETLTALHETTQTLMTATSQRSIAEHAVETARTILGQSINGVWLYDKATESLQGTAWTDEAQELIGELPSYRDDQSLSWEAFETGEIRVYDEMRSEAESSRLKAPVRSKIVLPLGDYGVMNICSTETRAFGEFDASIAQTFADLVETALGRVEYDRELERSRDLLHHTENLAGTGGWEADAETRQQRWTDGTYAIHDLPPDTEFEPTVDAGIAFYHPDDRDCIEEAIETCFETGESFDEELRLITAEDRLRWVRSTGEAITENGHVETVRGAIQDITDRREREQQLTHLNQTAQSLLTARTSKEVAEIGIEAARDVLELSASAIHFSCEDEAELNPVAATEEVKSLIGEPPTLSKNSSIAWRVYEEGEPRAIDDVRQDPDVHDPETDISSHLYLPLGEHGILIAGSEEPAVFGDEDLAFGQLLAGGLVAALDRVEREERLRKNEQELARQNERLDEFASIVSHELRNPLNIAQGRVAILNDETESEHLTHVANALDRIDLLIDDLLTLARSGDQVSDTEEVPISDTVKNCWQNVPTADATIDIETDQTVQADRSRLKQVFENLIRNAVVHGGEDVTVTIGPLENGFYIENTDSSIPPDERERVFEAGYTTSDEGTGLGLGIVKQIVEAHGWAIRVADSEEDRVRFEITNIDSM
jgi:PAS domain S-box-containing protein